MGSRTPPPSLPPLTLHDPVLITSPHSPLPPLYLTNIDQTYSSYINSVVHFFAPHPHMRHRNIFDVVRDALQRLLLHYPWVQGRVRFNAESRRFEVDCRNLGATFITATADVTLAELGDAVLTPNPVLDSLVPSCPLPPQRGEDDGHICLPILMIQVTRFKCGGFSLSTVISHMVFDAYSVTHFLQNLGCLARGKELHMAPSVVRERLMPRNPPSPMFDHSLEFRIRGKDDVYGRLRKEVITGKTYQKFIFTEGMLEQLRSKALSDKSLKKCTLFEALAAHIWMAMAKISDGLSPSQAFLVHVPINLRQRLRPPLPAGYFGNAVYPAAAAATIKELSENPLSFAVQRIQEAIARVTGEYVQSGLDWLELHNCEKNYDERTGIVVNSPGSGLPFDEVELGWGKPLCYCITSVDHGRRLFRCQGEGSHTRSLGVLVLMGEEESNKFRIATWPTHAAKL